MHPVWSDSDPEHLVTRFIWIGPVFVNVDHIVRVTDSGQSRINVPPAGGSWVTLSDGSQLTCTEKPYQVAHRISRATKR